MNSRMRVGTFFGINQKMQPVSFREAFDRSIFVLKDSRFQVASDAYVKRAPRFVRYDIDEETFSHLEHQTKKLDRPHEAGDDNIIL